MKRFATFTLPIFLMALAVSTPGSIARAQDPLTFRVYNTNPSVPTDITNVFKSRDASIGFDVSPQEHALYGFPQHPHKVSDGSSQNVTSSATWSEPGGPCNLWGAWCNCGGAFPQGFGENCGAEVLADASELGVLITQDQFGANMSVGFDITNPPSQAATLGGIGIGLLRWPGGSPADFYHWQTNTWSASPCYAGGSPNANSTFDDFEQTLVAVGKFDVAVTLNYGSNPQCNGPADPNEAAQWVAYAKLEGYAVKYWTVGNEVYGVGEIDLHSPGAHDPTTYANNVATQFYPLIKAQDATAQVGVVLDGGNYTSDNWDSIVLANAKYDFVEIHYYPENPGSESDSFLLTQGPSNFARTFAKVQQELVAAGHPNMPILLGEYNSPNYDPGKQTMSIVNALFVGMVQGEIMKAGIPLATIEDGYFGECNDSGNNSSTLYGWQDFGSYALFAGTTLTCSGAAGIPADTPFPIARALGLSSQFGLSGNRGIGVTVSTALPNLRAYAAQQGTGYNLMLFNLDESNAATITVGIANAPAKPYAGSMATYDKAIYDQSESGVWAAPSTQALGTVTPPLTVTLQPWSMNVITLQ